MTTPGMAEIAFVKQQQQNCTSFTLPPNLFPPSTSQAKAWLKTDLLADGKLLLWPSSMDYTGLPGPWDRGSWCLGWASGRNSAEISSWILREISEHLIFQLPHGFLLLSNIVTTNVNSLSSTIVTGFRLCQHIFESSLWEVLGGYLMLTPWSNINQHYNIYYYNLLAWFYKVFSDYGYDTFSKVVWN